MAVPTQAWGEGWATSAGERGLLQAMKSSDQATHVSPGKVDLGDLQIGIFGVYYEEGPLEQ